jgi:molybdenum cofactor guanylyltransferase
MAETLNLNGLILAGGKSSRMGSPKSLIDFHGKPQHQHLSELLKPFCQQVFISVSKNSNTSQSVATITDHFDLESPLNGIISAFHFDPQAAWLTVPVDMPNIDHTVAAYLIKHRNTTKTATCFLDTEGYHPEPLLAIWEPKAKPLLFNFFNGGGHSPRKFLQINDVCLIKAPNKSWLININTVEELKGYKKGNT